MFKRQKIFFESLISKQKKKPLHQWQVGEKFSMGLPCSPDVLIEVCRPVKEIGITWPFLSSCHVSKSIENRALFSSVDQGLFEGC